jgi:hypothetical protein
MSLSIQLVIVGVLAAYLLHWCSSMHRRNRKTSSDLFSELCTTAAIAESDHSTLSPDAARALAERVQQFLHEPSNEPWASFQNARLVMEIADCAEQESELHGGVEASHLVSLRREAMESRIAAILSVAR